MFCKIILFFIIFLYLRFISQNFKHCYNFKLTLSVVYLKTIIFIINYHIMIKDVSIKEYSKLSCSLLLNKKENKNTKCNNFFLSFNLKILNLNTTIIKVQILSCSQENMQFEKTQHTTLHKQALLGEGMHNEYWYTVLKFYNLYILHMPDYTRLDFVYPTHFFPHSVLDFCSNILNIFLPS